MRTAPHIRSESTRSSAWANLFARTALSFLLGSIFLASAPQLFAQSTDSQESSQDVAAAARQERACKQQSAKHVYTNEDLRRGKILTPEDQTRAAANPKPSAPPTTLPATGPLDANSTTPQEPLGDVARRYRDARRNSEKNSPFHIPSQQAELAAPGILAPVPKPAPGIFAPYHPSAPLRRGSLVPLPAMPSAPMHRVDPFSQRRMQPMPPAISLPVEPRVSVQPSAPMISHPRAASSAPTQSIIVQQGDTLWTLSRRHLGRGTRWLELMAANPAIADPTRLVPGTSLNIPSRSLAHRSATPSVVVHAGDTLSSLALTTYGHASYWPCVAQANPILSNPNRLAIGQSLVLPSSCAP
jgi:nucleoid-associated protein YgaU